MNWNEFCEQVRPFVPLLLTIAVIWLSMHLFWEQPSEFLRGVIRELSSLFERTLSTRAINLAGALIMLVLTLILLAEGLLQTAMEAADHSHPSPEWEIYKTSLKFAIIFFFGIYFIISISLTKREP
jgi:uncharacterized membrane protein